MKKFNLFFGLLAMTVLSIGIWSCSKDTPKPNAITEENSEIGLRSASLCESIITGLAEITEVSKNIPVNPCTLNSLQIPCPFGTLYSTDCSPTCASIGQGG